MLKWIIRNFKANKLAMQESFGISEIFATVLANRNLLTNRALTTYLNPDLKCLHNICQMKDVEKAINILNEFIKNNKKICIYGDYDVDGVTSTVIMYKGIKALYNNLFYYIPDREKEGYGLNLFVVEKLKNIGCDLIITCDNGIASIEEIEFVKKNGMSIIIIDHHEPRFEENLKGEKKYIIPNADAIIDTKQKDCQYPFKYLCTGGLAYKFIKKFYEYNNLTLENEDELLVFASIATICDIVDLIDENRIIAKKGIEILNKNKNINLGLFEILKMKGLDSKTIDEISYGFSIGPCINASGRLQSALKAVELFLTNQQEKASKIAKELCILNNKRKELTTEAFLRIKEKIENSELKNDNILVLYDENIHESIAGIVAGKIKDYYYKPTIVITRSIEECKGSGRSIHSYNMFESILEVSELFKKFGGHSMAVGISLKEDNIDLLRIKLNANNNLKLEDMTPMIIIDKEISFKDINIDLAKELYSMKPFGKENKESIFATKNVIIKNIKFIGKDNRVCQMKLIDTNNFAVDAISFTIYDKLKDTLIQYYDEIQIREIYSGTKKDIDLKFDVVYSIEVNKYNNLKNVQIHIKDLRIS